jgi:hypothetical protein
MWEDEARIPPPSYRSAPQRRAAEARRMMVGIGGVGAVLLLCVVGYVAATGERAGAVPVILAPSGPVKVKPDHPGGLQVNTQTSALLGSDGSAAGASLAPPPEVPDPAALAAAANEEQAPPSAPAALSATTSRDAAQPPATPAMSSASPAIAVPAIPETPAPSAPQSTALNISPPSAGAAAVHNLSQETNPPVRPAGHSLVRVQLAALTSQEAALREWEHLTHRMPALFDGRRPIFAAVRVNGHIFWRVRTGGFLSATEAAQFCNDVRTRGAACTVALF